MATLTKREMIERDIPIYAKNFNCSLEEARRDVESEYNATETDTDAFYERQESTDERQGWSANEWDEAAAEARAGC
jgi:hypothetical protein